LERTLLRALVRHAIEIVHREMPSTKAPSIPQTHPDGSACREGTRRVKRGFTPCCEAFDAHTRTCQYDVRYEWSPGHRTWGIVVCDGGSSLIVIEYCPHCGGRL
jgi:hypothetical protein